MGCLCRQKRKKDFAYIKSLAVKDSKINMRDLQIYKYDFPPLGEIYDFEPINPNRNTVVEYIRYRG